MAAWLRFASRHRRSHSRFHAVELASHAFENRFFLPDPCNHRSCWPETRLRPRAAVRQNQIAHTFPNRSSDAASDLQSHRYRPHRRDSRSSLPVRIRESNPHSVRQPVFRMTWLPESRPDSLRYETSTQRCRSSRAHPGCRQSNPTGEHFCGSGARRLCFQSAHVPDLHRQSRNERRLVPVGLSPPHR